MAIPKTRADLIELVSSSHTKLMGELDRADEGLGGRACEGKWSVKDLLAVRLWWTERVVEWVEAGRRGETPVTPAPDFTWHDTPRLNDQVVEQAREMPYAVVREQLEAGLQRVLDTIGTLDDRELLEVGVYAWAGRWPVARWISINTARQYTTARTLIRRVLRKS